MRILFLTRKWPPAIGGMETYAQEISAALAAQGHALDLRALPGRADGAAPGGGAILRFGAGQALSLLRGPFDPPDLIFGADMAIWPLAKLAAARAARAAEGKAGKKAEGKAGGKAEGKAGQGPRLLLAAHGTDVAFGFRPSAAGRGYGAYMRAGARACRGARVIANSDATADLARGLGFGPVGTVPLGCRTAPPDPLPPERREILFAGRLVRRKGLAWFVRNVLPLLPPDLPLRVAGTVWEAEEAAALSDPRVEFLGPLPQPALWSRMAAARAVILPNLAAGRGHVEGFGLVAAEAAAAGGLVLAPRLEGFLSSVIDGETGTLLPPGDAPAWAEAIRSLDALSPAARDARRRHAAAAAAARFDWDRCAAETLDFALS